MMPSSTSCPGKRRRRPTRSGPIPARTTRTSPRRTSRPRCTPMTMRGGSTGQSSAPTAPSPRRRQLQATDAVRTARCMPTRFSSTLTCRTYQPANQQLYQRPPAGGYSAAGEIAPLTPAGVTRDQCRQQCLPDGLCHDQAHLCPEPVWPLRFSRARLPRCPHLHRRPHQHATRWPTGRWTSAKSPAASASRPASYAATAGQPVHARIPRRSRPRYFLPLTIHNDGNVNLLNVHLDQKQFFNGADHVADCWLPTRWTRSRHSRLRYTALPAS